MNPWFDSLLLLWHTLSPAAHQLAQLGQHGVQLAQDHPKMTGLVAPAAARWLWRRWRSWRRSKPNFPRSQ